MLMIQFQKRVKKEESYMKKEKKENLKRKLLSAIRLTRLRNLEIWYFIFSTFIYNFHFQDEHKIEVNDLFKRMEVDPDKGLTSALALAKLKEYGENVLSEKKVTPWYIELFHELTGFF